MNSISTQDTCNKLVNMASYPSWKIASSVSKMVAIVGVLFLVSGCAHTIEAIDSRDLKTTVKMSDTIFLEPVGNDKQSVWLRIRNTSDKQDLDADAIRHTIEQKLVSKGYQIQTDPNKAQFRLEANILFADLTSDSLTAELATAGGFGGALSGSNRTGNQRLAGGIVGMAAGAVAGALIKINNYAMVIDIQVSEQVEGGVKTRISGQADSGGQTGKVDKSQSVDRAEKFLHHRARIAATAKQTNLKFAEAVPILSETISASLSGMF
jgi:hypothetical protein